MSTSALADRASRSTAEFAEAARAHLEDAERHATRAAESATRAAEQYGARAQQVAQDAADSFNERVTPQLTQLRDDAEQVWDDPEQRRLVLTVAGGIGLVAVGVWLWRRRRDDEQYEASAEEVAGWEDPSEALTTTAG